MNIKELKEVVKVIPKAYDNDEVCAERYSIADEDVVATGRKVNRIVYDFKRKLLVIS